MSRQSKEARHLIKGLASNLLGRCREVTVDYTFRPPKVILRLHGIREYVPGPRVQKQIVLWHKSGEIWVYIRRVPSGTSAVIRTVDKVP